MPGSALYAILDADACDARGLPLLEVGEGLCQAAPAMLQLRAKGRSARQVLDWLAVLRLWTRAHGTLLYVNDRADLAELGGCDGVHVGQDDLPLEAIRRHFSRLRVGVSTHSEEELARALRQEPDYVALGPIFATASKEKSEPALGLGELERLSPIARARGIPIVAIGGIDRPRAPLVARHADYLAVIAALLPPSLPGAGGEQLKADVLERARAYSDALG